MCMLFVFTNPNPGPDGYMVILASVRDEFYHRPTKECHFWERNPQILGGMDLEEGKKGGTWLAMNTSGKISSLLNIIQPVKDLIGGQKNRGFLPVRYLESQFDGPSYLRTLQRDSEDYNAYLLVTIDVSPSLGRARLANFTNSDSGPPSILRPGVHVFGNSVPRRPWKKVLLGKQKFQRVVTRHRSTKRKDALVGDLFNLLTDDLEYYPDLQLERDAEGRPEECVRQLSAIFIQMPETFYGSRTHSLILIDGRGQVDYLEKTMREPINVKKGVQWSENRFSFSIQEPNHLISRL